MSDSTTQLDTIVQGSGSQDLQANALYDSASPAMLYARRASTTSGTTWGYYGGKVRIAGVNTSISNGTLTLTPSMTNYVEAHPDTGAVSKNTTAFTVGQIPLYTVVCGASSITSYTDHRRPCVLNDTLAKALTDANTTLTQAEAANAVLTFTGTLTATRNITMPLVGKQQWVAYNGTTGGYALNFIGATGRGFSIKSGRVAVVMSDGTNIVGATLPMDAYTTDTDVYGLLNASGIKLTALATPAAATGVGSTTGGTLAAATYYTKIVALDSLGNMTPAGTESTGVVTTGSTSSIVFTWAAIPGAASYRIYYGTTAGAEANYYTSTLPTYTLAAAAGTSGSPPTVNTTGNLSVAGAGSTLGYATGSGGAVTQITSRTTGVTLNRAAGAITLVSAAGQTGWQTFTVTNSVVAATDTVVVSQKSGTDLNMIFVTAVAAGSFNITFATTGGTTTEQPVFNFSVIKGAAA